jgi:hypothetical protein
MNLNVRENTSLRREQISVCTTGLDYVTVGRVMRSFQHGLMLMGTIEEKGISRLAERLLPFRGVS